jgi:hypothetical protein
LSQTNIEYSTNPGKRKGFACFLRPNSPGGRQAKASGSAEASTDYGYMFSAVFLCPIYLRDKITFSMENGKSFVICPDDAMVDGYTLVWSADAKETVTICKGQ